MYLFLKTNLNQGMIKMVRMVKEVTMVEIQANLQGVLRTVKRIKRRVTIKEMIIRAQKGRKIQREVASNKTKIALVIILE